jgi:hypothetical protein
MATVVIVGCLPSMPRIIRHLRGQREESRDRSDETPNSQEYMKKNKLSSMAKYMGQEAVTTVSVEHLELHQYPSEADRGTRRQPGPEDNM